MSSDQIVNVRQGPTTAYPIIGAIDPGVNYRVVGKNQAQDWWQIEGNGVTGWVIGSLVNISGNTNDVATVTDIPAAPEVVSAAAPAAAAAPIAVSARAPTSGGSFGYGVQAHMIHNDQADQSTSQTQDTGFGWVKQQIEWRVFEPNPGGYQWSTLDNIVDSANGRGISLLFSVVDAPDWVRESGFNSSTGGSPTDPQTFANLLGALASEYCGTSLKALDIWNEQNIQYELGNKPLNPVDYAALLAPSYASIKAACPSMLVINSALTPASDYSNLTWEDMVYNDQLGKVMQFTQGMGFSWIKQQVEWRVFESNPDDYQWRALDRIVNAANRVGISLLFSVVNAPDWAREPGFDASVGGPPQDPQTFANFNGALAGKYCGSALKAIEIWNGQNMHYEWGNKPLNPAEYVALLAPSYASIKAACPSMLVISGALSPAGDNGNLTVDDFKYLDGMFAAGLNNYADGIGAHPSGYNVPPSNTWETACAAIQVSGNSFTGACDSPHHSWSFRSTMEGYRMRAVNAGAANKRIWPTEFGWAAGGALHPAYAYADDNSYEEQAAWTVEAYQMMKNWGWVGPAFLWNLNFRVVADGTEKAQWGIVRNDWTPLPVYDALRDMPK